MINTQLLQSCIRKDKKAQYMLYKQYFNFLMGVCIRYKKNEEEAREIVNQGFLKILNNLEKYPSNIPFETWMRRIMVNTIIDEYRKNKRRKETFEYTNFEIVEIYNDYIEINTADLNFDAEELIAIIKQLPPTSQKVFNLFAVDGYSHNEISKMLDINVGASKWHVSNARKMLKKMITETLQINKTV